MNLLSKICLICAVLLIATGCATNSNKKDLGQVSPISTMPKNEVVKLPDPVDYSLILSNAQTDSEIAKALAVSLTMCIAQNNEIRKIMGPLTKK